LVYSNQNSDITEPPVTINFNLNINYQSNSNSNPNPNSNSNPISNTTSTFRFFNNEQQKYAIGNVHNDGAMYGKQNSVETNSLLHLQQEEIKPVKQPKKKRTKIIHENSANSFTNQELEGETIDGDKPKGVIRMVNEAGRNYKCLHPSCGKSFKRMEHLKRHGLIHTGECPHHCTYPNCKKIFSRKDNLTQHYKTHLRNH